MPTLHENREGDGNALHGEPVFPLQVAISFSNPGADQLGGEFLLYEQRPRAQSRATATPIPLGHGLVFATRDRPFRPTHRWPARPLRHAF